MLKRDIQAFIQKLSRGNNDAMHMSEYSDYVSALSELANLLDVYMVPTADGYPKLKAQDISGLQKAYENALKAGRTFNNVVEADPNKTAADVTRSKMISGFEELLAREHNVMDVSVGTAEKTLPDVLSVARGVRVTIKKDEISSAGANLSSRIPVSYTASNGEVIRGFFTGAELADPDSDKEALFNKAVDGHPEYEEIFRDFMNSQFYNQIMGDMDNAEESLDGFTKDDFKYIAEEYVKEIIKEKSADKSEREANKIRQKYTGIINNITTNDEFAVRFYNFSKSYSGIQAKYDTLKNTPKIDTGSNISDRNVAMCEIAAALGAPNLLAHSVKMKLVVDGVERDGTFMAYAEGTDILNIKDDDPIRKITPEGLNNPAAFRSIADLQAIDFICGNTDRHNANMFYKTEVDKDGKVKFAGLVGIDNDCSMGKLDPPTSNGKGVLTGSDNMIVMSRECADRITSMTKDMLEIRLKGLAISKDEINAAYNRLQHLQKCIAEGKKYFKEHKDEKLCQGHIKVVEDHEWKNYTLEELAETKDAKGNQKSYANRFSSVLALPEAMKLTEKRKKDQIEKNEALKAINPGLDPEGGRIKMAAAGEVRETNAKGIESNKRKLDSFQAKMLHLNAGFFVSSKEFDDVMKQFGELREAAGRVTPRSGSRRMAVVAKEYKKLQNVIKKYIDRKEKQLRKKGELNERAKRRLAFVKDLYKFADEKISNIKSEMELNSYELKAYFAKEGPKWDEKVVGKPYSPDKMADVAMALVKKNFTQRPFSIDSMAMNDFNKALLTVYKSNAFREALIPGEVIDLKNLEKSILREMKMEKRVDNHPEKANERKADNANPEANNGIHL